jgi:alkanesulfonate monooxygenase SsuD/methylene tetrahydromethanopterin reductase-like flavin-dependent oxidoreductase (luciferase family)
MSVLDAHCERLGRNPADICRTRLGTLVVGRTMEEAGNRIAAPLGASKLDDLPDGVRQQLQTLMIIGDADAVGEQVQAFLDAGLDGMISNIPDSGDLEAVALAGSILRPLLRP